MSDAEGRRRGERGALLCRCLHWACTGLLAGQLLLLLGLQRTPSSRPPKQRPVSHSLVAVRPVHLSHVRITGRLEGVWRQREAFTLLGSESLMELGENKELRMMRSVTGPAEAGSITGGTRFSRAGNNFVSKLGSKTSRCVSLDAVRWCSKKGKRTGLFYAKQVLSLTSNRSEIFRLEAGTNWYSKAAAGYFLCTGRSRIHLWSKAGLLFCEKHNILAYTRSSYKLLVYSGEV